MSPVARNGKDEGSVRAPDPVAIVEAVLFAAAGLVREDEIAAFLPMPRAKASLAAWLRELQSRYAKGGVRVVCIDGAWGMRTAPELAPCLTRLRRRKRKLSAAAMETLAICAYHQPVTRADIEDIRGHAVAAGTLDALVRADWVKPLGRKEVAGRPLMWGTTRAFLDHFGLPSLDALPPVEELRGMRWTEQEADADAKPSPPSPLFAKRGEES